MFVNPQLNEIMRYVDAGIDTVQLHGDESAGFARTVPDCIGLWKAVRPRCDEDILKYKNYPAEKFLIDTFLQDQFGGTGKTGSPELAQFAVINLPAPVIVAGGINPDNVLEIVKRIRPSGIDVSSGVEFSPGKKDRNKIRLLIEKIASE